MPQGPALESALGLPSRRVRWGMGHTSSKACVWEIEVSPVRQGGGAADVRQERGASRSVSG